jgi:hypothetical protein
MHPSNANYYAILAVEASDSGAEDRAESASEAKADSVKSDDENTTKQPSPTKPSSPSSQRPSSVLLQNTSPTLPHHPPTVPVLQEPIPGLLISEGPRTLPEKEPNNPTGRAADVVEQPQRGHQPEPPMNMATHLAAAPGEGRRGGTLSPRPNKARENKANILCRNIGIYGHCRYESEGCPYNHDPSSFLPKATLLPNPNENMKRGFSADSPAFTPRQPNTNGTSSAPRSTTISPKSANAAPFTPKTNQAQLAAATNAFQPKDATSQWAGHDFQEFIPGTFDQGHGLAQADPTAAANLLGYSDPYTALSLTSGIQGMNTAHAAAQANPYATDASSMGGTAFYGAAHNFAQPAQYHLYAPMGTDREKLQGYQRLVYDLFIPQDIREEIQRKAEASLQTLPSKLRIGV